MRSIRRHLATLAGASLSQPVLPACRSCPASQRNGPWAGYRKVATEALEPAQDRTALEKAETAMVWATKAFERNHWKW